jgi:hypothetical protein
MPDFAQFEAGETHRKSGQQLLHERTFVRSFRFKQTSVYYTLAERLCVTSVVCFAQLLNYKLGTQSTTHMGELTIVYSS